MVLLWVFPPVKFKEIEFCLDWWAAQHRSKCNVRVYWINIVILRLHLVKATQTMGVMLRCEETLNNLASMEQLPIASKKRKTKTNTYFS